MKTYEIKTSEHVVRVYSATAEDADKAREKIECGEVLEFREIEAEIIEIVSVGPGRLS